MALFRRMKDMALQAAQGQFVEPEADDEEGQVAARLLEKLWKEMRSEINRERSQKDRVSQQAVQGQEYYHRTLERIREAESLVFDGWRLGHGEVAYIKDFGDHNTMKRAREILMMVNFADGNPGLNMRGPEYELPDIRPDRELKNAIKQREKTATALAVRRDWMTEYSIAEKRPVGVVK